MNILIPILYVFLTLTCVFLVGPLSIAVQNIGQVSILSKKRRMENNRHVDESGKQKLRYMICKKLNSYKAFDLKWGTNWIIFSDDTHDGTASFAYNRFTKNDEWSRNQKRNGTNASKYECSKPGN